MITKIVKMAWHNCQASVKFTVLFFNLLLKS
jgi:hypothetical protein